MSACDEMRPKAAGIAALPEGDPERESFLAHARGCPGCMQALREGEKLLEALARAELPTPSSRALRRASAPILADLTPSRWGLRALAALVAFAIPLLFSRHRDTEGWTAALVVLALWPELDGAVALGVVEVEGAVLVCAMALVKARVLTAAAAMILLSMSASLGANFANGFRERFHGRRRKVGVLARKRRNRAGVPIVEHIDAAFAVRCGGQTRRHSSGDILRCTLLYRQYVRLIIVTMD